MIAAMSEMPSVPRALRSGLPAIVFLWAFLAFKPALDAGWVDWDDHVLFVDAHGWRGLGPAQIRWMFTSWPLGHYHPVTWLTHGLDYELWGMRAQGHHLTNVLLHATVATLLYALGVALLRARGTVVSRDDEISARVTAACGALLWAVHPLRVEAVAWITERRELVCGILYLLTLIFYLRMVADPARRTTWYVASIAAFALSLLSKAWGITLPVVLLIADLWLLGRFEKPGDRRRVLLEKVPFFALTIPVMIVTTLAHRAVGASLSLEQHSATERVLQAGYGILFYPIKTIAPVNLTPSYFLSRQLTLGDPVLLASLLGTIAITAGLFVARRRAPALLVAWLAYVVTVSPVLGLHQSGAQLVADRYAYIATIFLFLLAVALHRRVSVPQIRLVAGCAVVVAAAWTAATWRQCACWKDTLSLWTRAVTVDPANYFARTRRSMALHQLQRHEEAIAECDAAIGLAPRFANAWSYRGAARMALRDLPGAIGDFDHALRLNPDHVPSLMWRAQAHMSRRDARSALADFDRVVALEPRVGGHYVARGVARRALGDVRGAMADFDEAIRRSPSQPEPYLNRGHLRMQQREPELALADFNECLRLQPGHVPALMARARTREEVDDLGGAAEDYAQLLHVTARDWPMRGDVERSLAAVRERLARRP